MPVSRLTKSLKKNKSQQHTSEIKYIEKKTRGGAIKYLPVNVPTSSTPTSSSPSTSRQSTVDPASHMMEVDNFDNPLGDYPQAEPSKKSRKSTQVLYFSLHIFSTKCETC